MGNENGFDPKKAAEERKKEMEDIAAKLEAGVKEVFQGENFKKYLDFCARLPRYSVNNQLLIMMQKPNATICQSYTGWKEAGRHVKKGEKGIRILAPAPYKMEREQDKLDAGGKPVLDRDGEPVKETVEIKINAFKPVSTFDVSQTEGDPLPRLGVTELIGGVEGYETLMEAIRQSIPVPISFENIDGEAKGYYHLEENRIVVQEGMSEVQTIKTVLHEASHQALHSKEAMEKSGDKKSRNQKEIEAESVAYVVCQHYGIETSDYSFAYVAGWAGDREAGELKAALDTIRGTASFLIGRIDDKVREMTSTKDIDAFLALHGDELPFDSPEANEPAGYIKIMPPVDMGMGDTSRAITLSVQEPEKDAGDRAPEQPAKGRAPGKKKEAGRDKTDEQKPEKRKSLKERLRAGKEKPDKSKTPGKNAAKDLQQVI